MKQYDVGKCLLSCILLKPSLMNEVYIDAICFNDPKDKYFFTKIQEYYNEHKNLELTLIVDSIKSDYEKNLFIEMYGEISCIEITPSSFYEYQERLMINYKNAKVKEQINEFSKNKLNIDELVENIDKINNEILVVQQSNKVTPEEMLAIVRNKEKLIEFPRFKALNEKLKIKKKTVNVIGARPSEGKSALALNLFCDLAKNYKCIYFNMEMTEAEVYERMLGIETDMPISDVIAPLSDYQENHIKEVANKIYNYKYEIINGSKTVSSIKNKIIKDQRDEHLIVFIDYVGYIVGKQGETDRDRIGNAVRELNNITKDYNCTIFLVAQINRNGSDVPTMQDLKDSGELEQTADTIILIHDDNKANNEVVKEIGFLIPKCRGGKRNIRIPVEFNKVKQRMSVK